MSNERMYRGHLDSSPIRSMHSNQETLGNGCVCEHGCDSCDRLAEAWEAMRVALVETASAIDGAMWSGEWTNQVRAALALADRVKVRQ